MEWDLFSISRYPVVGVLEIPNLKHTVGDTFYRNFTCLLPTWSDLYKSGTVIGTNVISYTCLKSQLYKGSEFFFLLGRLFRNGITNTDLRQIDYTASSWITVVKL